MIRRAHIAFVAVMMILPSAGGVLAQPKVPAKTIDTRASILLSDEKQIRVKAFVKHIRADGEGGRTTDQNRGYLHRRNDCPFFNCPVRIAGGRRN